MKIKQNLKYIGVAVLAVAVCMCLASCKKKEKKTVKPPAATTVTTVETTTEPPITRPPPVVLPEMEEWLAINEDVIGYIKIGDTRIDYPVLQGDDNDYYMDYEIDHCKDPNKNHSHCWSEACITADYKGVYDGWDYPENVILLGHNSVKGTYFASLSNYYNYPVDRYTSYPIVEFNTLYEKFEYKIFACVLFNTREQYGEVIPYWDYGSFKDKNDFNDFMLKVMDRSVLHTGVDIEYGDKIMTLSTCLYPYGKEVDSRVVVFARQVREGESSEVDLDAVKHNRQAIRFAEEEKRIGTLYPDRRVWHTCKLLKSYTGECELCEYEKKQAEKEE